MFVTIEKYLQGEFSRYREVLREMVALNSYTRNPAGVAALGFKTAAFFAPLGFSAEQIPSENPEFGPHLVLTRSGTGAHTISMVSHLDTVFPPEEEQANNFRWRIDGEQVFGPGTVDIKGGTTVMLMVLEGLRQFFPDVFEETTWKLFLNASEETTNDDFAPLVRAHCAADTLACLVFEGGAFQNNTFSLVTARKGMAIYRVIVEGKAAHAGSSHEQGANAIVQMSRTIQQIAALTDYDRQLTFNVGTVTGGVVTNRVPHYAEAWVEMRTFSPAVFADGVATMMALNGETDLVSADGFPCKVTVDLMDETAPWPTNDATEFVYRAWEEAAQALGVQVQHEERGGLSDGNDLWAHFPTIDALGPSGGAAHCSEHDPENGKSQEYARLDSFIPKTLLNIAGILKLVEHTSALD